MTVRYQCEAAGLSKSAEASEGMVRQESCLGLRRVVAVGLCRSEIGISSDVKICTS